MGRPSQEGSAHVVLVVLLIVAVLGGVGYIGYRAYMKKADTSAGTSAQTQQSSSKSAVITGTRELGFDDWGVAVIVPKSENLYLKKYVAASGEPQFDVYEVYDTNFDRYCPYTSPNDTSIGTLQRAKLTDQVDTYFGEPGQTNRDYFTKNTFNSVIYGDYAYYYIKPNGSYECTDPSKTDGTAAIDALGQSRTTFINALSSMRLTTK